MFFLKNKSPCYFWTTGNPILRNRPKRPKRFRVWELIQAGGRAPPPMLLFLWLWWLLASGRCTRWRLVMPKSRPRKSQKKHPSNTQGNFFHGPKRQITGWCVISFSFKAGSGGWKLIERHNFLMLPEIAFFFEQEWMLSPKDFPWRCVKLRGVFFTHPVLLVTFSGPTNTPGCCCWVPTPPSPWLSKSWWEFRFWAFLLCAKSGRAWFVLPKRFSVLNRRKQKRWTKISIIIYQ